MINKIILTLLAILICCTALAQATQISVEPAHVAVPEGGIFTVDIMVYPEGNETYAAQYTLSFDNTILNAIEQTKGTFLSQDGVNTNTYGIKINNTLGKIEYGESRTGVYYGVTNPGVLTTIEFEVIAEHGTSGLLFDVVKLVELIYEDPYYVSYCITGVVVNNGSVEIVSGICGDVTGNGVVDTGDVILLANYVGYSGYTLQNEWAGDVTGNGVIDTGDVILLANYVGYPGYSLNCT